MYYMYIGFTSQFCLGSDRQKFHPPSNFFAIQTLPILEYFAPLQVHLLNLGFVLPYFFYF